MTMTEEPNAGDDYLTSGQVARILQVDTTTIRRWVDNGTLACVRDENNNRRFRRSDVLTWVLDHQSGGDVPNGEIYADVLAEPAKRTKKRADRTTAGDLAATPEPVSDRVMALLRYPMPAKALKKLIKGLERTYGKGLVIVTDGDDWRDEWMTVALPGEMTDGRVENVDGVRQPVRLSGGDVRGEGVRHRSPG